MTWTLALANLSEVAPDPRPVCKWCGMRFEIKSVFARKQEYCCTECRTEDRDRQRRRFATTVKQLEKCVSAHQKKREKAEYFRQLMAGYERKPNG